MTRHRWVFAIGVVAVLAAGGLYVWKSATRYRVPSQPGFAPGWRLPSRPVSIVTYNIEFGNRLEEALALVRGQSPDLVCLQEIRPGQMPAIKRSLGMEGAWFPSSNLISNAEWGNAVFARTVSQGQSMPNPHGGSFGMWAAVEVEGARFLAGSVHLMHAKSAGAGFEVRGREIRALLDAIDAAGAPALIAGDFNNPPVAGNYKMLTDRLVDLSSESGATLPSSFPLLRIDYVFGTREWAPVSAKVLPTTISDHRPVVVVAKPK